MTGDITQVAGDAVPFVTAAVGAYGLAVLARTQEEAANVTVELGRRMAQRIFGPRAEGEEPPEAVADLVTDPDDPDVEAVLRRAVRKALLADETLAADLRALLAQAPAGVRIGDNSQAVVGSVIGGDSIQIGSVGGDVRLGLAAGD
ncbi:hypothetical protein ABZT04_15380 [Streptomyces sp. NPDC005492]|uniref:hypothetical protein n=1 Tax=Streptomyces sp. NPDC005492 TaxID=3156883 RepID=UPI00339DEBB1